MAQLRPAAEPLDGRFRKDVLVDGKLGWIALLRRVAKILLGHRRDRSASLRAKTSVVSQNVLVRRDIADVLSSAGRGG
jgi:hypothetical protein